MITNLFGNLNFISKLQVTSVRKCYSMFGIRDLIHQEKLQPISIKPLQLEDQPKAVEAIKQFYLPENVFMKSRNVDLTEDRALDEYIKGLLRQGNSLLAKTAGGDLAGVCVNFASCHVDCKNLRTYAFYRQDPNTKDFLYFTAKLQETPNLWDFFKENKIFEVKMLTVMPDYRRQGIAVSLVEKSKELAADLGYNVVRMNCVNVYDHKIAERSSLQCLVKYPLHKLRGQNAPFIKKNSEHNTRVRVYVSTRTQTDKDSWRNRQTELAGMME